MRSQATILKEEEIQEVGAKKGIRIKRGLKKILEYTIWFILTLLMSMVILKIEFNLRYDRVVFYSTQVGFFEAIIILFIGGIIGIISFLFFVPLHIYFIKKMFKEKKMERFISLLIIFILTLLTTIGHYFLEFVLNWI